MFNRLIERCESQQHQSVEFKMFPLCRADGNIKKLTKCDSDFIFYWCIFRVRFCSDKYNILLHLTSTFSWDRDFSEKITREGGENVAEVRWEERNQSSNKLGFEVSSSSPALYSLSSWALVISSDYFFCKNYRSYISQNEFELKFSK